MAVAQQAMAAAPVGRRARGAEQAEARPVALPALTGLRFVAALQVVALHYASVAFGATSAPGWLKNIALTGYTGVDLFFVLSGFILAVRYLLPSGQMRGNRRAFYSARVARVYPVYLLALALIAVPALCWHKDTFGEPPLTAAAAIALVQAWWPVVAVAWNGPGWSLSVEAVFYLLFPVLAVRLVGPLCSDRALLRAAALAYLALVVPALLYLAYLPDGAHYTWLSPWAQLLAFNPLLRLPEFGVGLALGRLFVLRCRCREAGPAGPVRAQRWYAWGALSLVTLPVLAAALALGPFLPPPLVQHGLYAPLFGALIYGLARGKGPLAALLASGPLQRLGEASYAMYLLQAPLWAWLLALLRVPVAAAPLLPALIVLQMASLVALSLLVYRLVERPARRALLHGL